MTTFLEQVNGLKEENKKLIEENKLLKISMDEILWPKEITSDLHIKDPETNDKYSFGENSTSKIKDDIADNSEMKRILKNGSKDDINSAYAFYMFQRDGVLYYVGRRPSKGAPLHFRNIKTLTKIKDEI